MYEVNTSNAKRSPGGESEKKRVSVIMKRYEDAKQRRSVHDADWRELDEFYRGDQYKNLSGMPPWFPRPVTNMVHLAVTTKRAAFAVDNPQATLRPVAESERERVNELQQIFDWVWKRVKARNVVRDNIETSKLLGTAIAHVYWDENTGVLGGEDMHYTGEIRVTEIDPSNFFPDPNANRLEDCQFIHVVEKKPREWVESIFNIKLKLNDQGNWTIYDNDVDIYERADRFSDIGADKKLVAVHAHYEKYWHEEPMTYSIPVEEEVPRLEIDPETGEESTVAELDEESGMPVEATETEVVGYREEPKMNPETGDVEMVGGFRYKVTYVVGDQILRTIDPLEPNMYPFAILYDYKQRKQFWGKSTASLIIDNQKIVNKVEGVAAQIATLMQNPQKIVHKMSGIRPAEAMKYSNAPGHTFYSNMDPARSMQYIQPPQLPPAVMQVAETAKQNIREVIGLNEAYMGQTVGSLQTSSGVDALIDRATLRDRDQMIEIEEYIESLSRLIIAFITTKYEDERWMRIIEDPTNPDATMYFKRFIGTDFRDIDYDFEIDVSASAPISRQRRAQDAKDLIAYQGQYGQMFPTPLIEPEEFIDMADFQEKERIIKRMRAGRVQRNMDKIGPILDMFMDAYMQAIETGVAMDAGQLMEMAEQMLQQQENGTIDPNAPGVQPDAPGTGGGMGSTASNANSFQDSQGAAL